MVSFLKLSTLSILYFVQGAPYGFQSACLPIILRSQGLSYTALGILKLLFLPWVCKPFYAPLVDRTFNRKWWLQSVSIPFNRFPNYKCYISYFLVILKLKYITL